MPLKRKRTEKMAERKKREADIILQSQLGGFEQPDCLDFSHSFEMTSTFNGHFDRAKRREISKSHLSRHALASSSDKNRFLTTFEMTFTDPKSFQQSKATRNLKQSRFPAYFDFLPVAGGDSTSAQNDLKKPHTPALQTPLFLMASTNGLQ